MQNQYSGIFYNGISSAAQTITISFYHQNDFLRFTNENYETFEWNLNEITFDLRGETLYLQQGINPVQIIKTDNSEFLKAIDQFRNEKGLVSPYQKLLNLDFKTHLAIAVAILGVIVLGYFYIIPWVAEKSVVLIPEEYDNQVGSACFETYLIDESIDVKKTKILNDFAKELQLNNNRKLNFTVVDAPIVNAFSLPDGNIVIYTGILENMKSYEQLVGLIGHEVSHVNNRHSMKMLCRNLSGYLFVSTILGDANGIMATIGDNANTLQSLSFSREFEKEADTDGLAIVNTNKVNPMGMINLFKELQQEEHFLKIPGFLSTHPITSERIKYIQNRIDKQPHQFVNNPKLKELFQKIKN